MPDICSAIWSLIVRSVVVSGLVRGLFAIALCVGAAGVGAADLTLPLDRLRFEKIEASEDFASIAVISLLQDRRGFIWVGTRDGLYRYDGRRFVEYRAGDGKSHGLTDNWIERLFEDSSGRIWIALRGGVARYDFVSDRFEAYDLAGDYGSVKGFVENDAGDLIVLGESSGLYRFEEGRGFTNVYNGFSGTMKCLVWDDELGYLVGGSSGLELVGRDFSGGRVYASANALGGVAGAFLTQIVRVGNDRLWVGTISAGAWMVDIGSGEWTQVPMDSDDESLVGSLLVDSRGSVLVGSTAGLKAYSFGGEALFSYHSSEFDRDAIQAGTVWSMLLDKQGNLWVGTSRGGLSVVRNLKAFGMLKSSRGNPLGLSKEKVTSVYVDSKERLWVGYHNEGLDRIDFRRGEKKFFDSHLDVEGALGRGAIWDIRETDDGSMWIGSNLAGLQRLAPGSERFEMFVPDVNQPEAIRGADLRVILPDEKGNFWLALHGVGLDYFNRESGVFEHYEGLGRNWVEDLVLDKAGNLWVASSDGLSFLAKGSRTFVDYNFDEADERSLSDRHVMCLFFDSRGTLWVGTRNGLCSLSAPGDGFQRYGLVHGLPSMSIRSLLESESGDLWVATGGGLARLDRGTGSFRSFDKKDGLLSNEFVDRSAFLAAGDVLMFGSEKGIVRFESGSIQINRTPPDVVITGVSLLNEMLDISSAPDGILRSTPYTAERVVFPAGQTTFGFEFSALDYLGTDENEFEYKLENFDERWVRNGKRSDCFYTNIPPGKYMFRVRASNGDGVWSEGVASLAVVVLPYYWQTVWFRVLVGLLLVLAVIVFFKFRMANLARQKIQLQDMVSERTKDLRDALVELGMQKERIEDQNLELIDHRENLEELILQRTSELVVAKERAEESDRLKSAFLENISHEIRTPMNAIIGFVNILRAGGVSEEEQAEYLEIIESNGDYLTAMIDDILELSLLESEQVALVSTPLDVAEFFQRWAAYLSNELEEEGKTGIVSKLLPDSELPNPFVLDVDGQRMDQILKNLLDNAVKFTDSGQISIGYAIVGENLDTLSIEVTDTGVGIPKDKLSSIFNLFRKILGERKRLYRGTGLGLAIVKRIVDLMGGTVVVQSVLGEGTCFRISLPIAISAIEGKGTRFSLRVPVGNSDF